MELEVKAQNIIKDPPRVAVVGGARKWCRAGRETCVIPNGTTGRACIKSLRRLQLFFGGGALTSVATVLGMPPARLYGTMLLLRTGDVYDVNGCSRAQRLILKSLIHQMCPKG